MNSNNKKTSLRFLDYFFVLRPMLFFPGWSTLLAGYLIAYKSRLFLTYNEFNNLDLIGIGLVLFIFGSAMGISFLLNQLEDIESDRRNNKLFIISEGHITKKSVIFESITLGLISIFLAFCLSYQVGIIVIAFIVVTGFFYNFKPINLKDKPWGSLMANALMGWIAFAFGWSMQFSWSFKLVIDSIPYLFFNTALYLFTILPDLQGDKITSKHTLAVIFGINKIIFFSFSLYVTSFISAIFLDDWTALFFTILALPFFILTIRNNDIVSAVRTTKFSILFFAVAICLKIPYYLVLMVLLFFLTRWYFYKRFNFNYPNFKGA